MCNKSIQLHVVQEMLDCFQENTEEQQGEGSASDDEEGTAPHDNVQLQQHLHMFSKLAAGSLVKSAKSMRIQVECFASSR